MLKEIIVVEISDLSSVSGKMAVSGGGTGLTAVRPFQKYDWKWTEPTGGLSELALKDKFFLLSTISGRIKKDPTNSSTPVSLKSS